MFGALGSPQYHVYAKDVHDSGQLLLDIINDILDLSKIEAGRMELFPEAVVAQPTCSRPASAWSLAARRPTTSCCSRLYRRICRGSGSIRARCGRC